MYAVVETGGKQYKVAIGDKVKVEKLSAEEGDSINVGRVLMVADGDNIDVGAPTLDIAVTATVVGHGRAKKIRVFKMKRRKNYRRTYGHRQSFTELEITGIGGEQAVPKPAKSQDVKSQAAADKPANKPADKSAKKPAEKSAKKPAEKSAKKPAEKSARKQASPASTDTGADGAADKLTDINGIGPVIEEKLHGLGITTFQQIADLEQDRIDEINEQLSFKGRIEREEWVSQAQELLKK